jgi:ribosome-associated heat shock protein Hsp15
VARLSRPQKLYSEPDESRKAREEKIALMKIERQSNPFPGGRPTKKARRQIIKFPDQD